MSDLLTELASRRSERLRKGWGSYAPRQPIPSDLHDCSRYQVMRVVAWKVRGMPDDEGLQIIEQGTVDEAAVIRQLVDEGWEIVEQQAPFEIRQPLEPGGPKKRILSGKRDGKIRVGPKRLISFEVKSTSEWVFEALDTDDDVRTHSVWTRKWWRQLQVYMLDDGQEEILLIVTFRGRRKAILVRLDYDAAEEILQVATWAVWMIENAEQDGIDETNVDAWLNEHGGERAAYHPSMVDCRRCPFFQKACHPPENNAITAKARPELEPLARKLLAAKPHASEYEKLRKALKAETEGCPTTVAGPFVIEGEVKTRKMKEKPAEPAHVQEYWQIEVQEVGKAAAAEEGAA